MWCSLPYCHRVRLVLVLIVVVTLSLVVVIVVIVFAHRRHVRRCRCSLLSLLLTCPFVLCGSPLLSRCHCVNAPLLVVMPLKSRCSNCTKMKKPVWSQGKWMSSDGEKQIVKEKPEHQNLGQGAEYPRNEIAQNLARGAVLSCVEKWCWEMREIPSLQNPWWITQLKYWADGSYGNNIINNPIINKYFSRDTLYQRWPICNVCLTHIIYNLFYTTYSYTHNIILIITNFVLCDVSQIDQGLRTTSRQISFEFLFIKTCPPDKLRYGFQCPIEWSIPKNTKT